MPAALWLTIDAALLLVILSRLGQLTGGPGRRATLSLGLWTAAWLLYVAHVVIALVIVHHGSHAEAYAHTARRTLEWTGIDSGAGLYLNDLFTLAWTGEIICRWLDACRVGVIPRRVYFWFDVGFIFMIVNGAIVFAAGPVRMIGALAVAAIVASWFAVPVVATLARRASEGSPPAPTPPAPLPSTLKPQRGGKSTLPR